MKNKGTRNDTGSNCSGLKDNRIGTDGGSRHGGIVDASNNEGRAVHGRVPGSMIECHGASEESREREDGGTKIDNRHRRSHKRRCIAHIITGEGGDDAVLKVGRHENERGRSETTRRDDDIVHGRNECTGNRQGRYRCIGGK